MRIGIPKEHVANESRVAATPKTVKQLINLGFSVAVENDAGILASFKDSAFVAEGAILTNTSEVWQSDIILKVNAPTDHEIAFLESGTILISFIWPAQNSNLLKILCAKNVTVMAMDAVPRISRAQSLDALSSMANIAGYRAIIEAAYEFGRFFTGQITAAGKVAPAKVMVIGAGVAGLAAIGTAGSLGAIVYAFDTRPEVKEQVQSMGAQFLELDFKEKEEAVLGTDGYASVMSEEFIKAEMALFSAQAQEVDIIITTALIPGKPAPRLITKEMVASMKPGSVIVDLAAQTGGNCELTVTDTVTLTDNGVRIIGYTNLPSRLPTQSSQLYATNLINLLKLLCKEKNGKILVDFNDVVIRAVTVIRNGELTWPAPPIKISPQATLVKASPVEPPRLQSPLRKYGFIILAILLFGALANVAPRNFLSHFTIFALACIVGYYVVWNVRHALHTPLMSVTNAISGIIVIGALLQIGDGGWVSFLSFIAVLIASINIFGGFTVTQRMLKMFRKN
ncbi:MAG: Re/Si-specific NAD(P)(+) transhydrogenase subunit alpha [Sodalis sp. (in: enterobacteria)]